MSETNYRFKDKVYAPPYAPYYDQYQGHTFVIDHYNEEDELRQHVWLTCVSDPSILVRGYVELNQLETEMTAQEAAKLLLSGLEDPDYGDANIPGFRDINWQKVYTAMTEDHQESLDICGTHDWPCTLITALTEIAGED